MHLLISCQNVLGNRYMTLDYFGLYCTNVCYITTSDIPIFGCLFGST